MNATATYYRTAKGSHVHADFECANQRRALESGTPVAVAFDELAPCEHCCDTEMVAQAATVAQAKQDAQCANQGVTNPKRIQSNCTNCGKLGKVDRSTGKLRAHKPQH